MKTYFEKLISGQSLTENESYCLLNDIVCKRINETQVISILAFLASRPLHLQELTGFKNALLEHRISVKLDKYTMDICGTGGDGKNTFNISTISALVLAAVGVPIAKHGNFGSTSITGSSDILQFLGYKFTDDCSELNRRLDNFNFCFMHAPLFHPALKSVAHIRREIGFRTFFNLLGPLVNPANLSAQFTGVFNLETARLYNYHLHNSGIKYSIVHSMDGYDEVSLTSDFKLLTPNTDRELSPMDLGMPYVNPNEILAGNSKEESAKIFVSVLKNSCTNSQKAVVIANAALAYCCYFPKVLLADARDICAEAIVAGKAYQLFKKIVN